MCSLWCRNGLLCRERRDEKDKGGVLRGGWGGEKMEVGRGVDVAG